MEKRRAPRNRTVVLSEPDRARLRARLLAPGVFTSLPEGTLLGDSLALKRQLPPGSVDLLFLDPPYNLDKSIGDFRFSARSAESYTAYLEELLESFKPLLKPTGTIYLCGDWRSSASIFPALSRHFVVRNRITWEREKGRGAQGNWKNASEDIWFATVSEQYTFNLEAVKLRRRVRAPYREAGVPKDWEENENGRFRDTHPSNLWTDITVPFWSMPENTDHPTQKSEKLLAKLILASTHPGDWVLDPFLGSGTTAVVARKLGRHCLGIELQEEYCLLAERRLELVEEEAGIQGWTDGVFWERNARSGTRKE